MIVETYSPKVEDKEVFYVVAYKCGGDWNVEKRFMEENAARDCFTNHVNNYSNLETRLIRIEV